MRMLRLLAAATIATAAMSCASRQATAPKLRWVPDAASPGQATVEAVGIDWHPGAAPGRLLRVYAGSGVDPDSSSVPAMLGAYELEGRVLRFRPAFPLEPGVNYEAVLDLRALPGHSRMLNGFLTSTWSPQPRPEAPATIVSRVYPSADELPENLLKFYIYFSAPMSRGGVYRHVRLLDGSGAEVELPFLELEEELWDPAMTRLTLFIDPGRIKRGVRPLEEIGPALKEGGHYTLVIDRDMVDAAGKPLGREFKKSFTVGPPDRDPPDPARWKVTPPRASTSAPLTIEFPDPMDRALAERLIRVTTAGRAVQGTVSLADEERRWSFTPDRPWSAGRYEIVVQPTIEDLAGNNVGKPFEVEMGANGIASPDLQPVRLPVDIR